MPIDPVSQAVLATASKEALSQIVRRLVKRTDKVGKEVSKDFTVLGQEMCVLCPESTQKFSIAFETKKDHLLPKKKKFRFGEIRSVELRQARSLKSLTDAVILQDDGFDINLKSLPPGELYILDMEYSIDEKNFIDSLVSKHVASDAPSEDTREYWMDAQLKHPSVFKDLYENVSVRDLDFGVDVGIHQAIKLNIPGIFKQQLETMVELMKKKGRSEKFRLMMRLQQLQKRKYGGRELDILKELQDLFFPSKFRDFVEVKQQFRYSDCLRGTDFYDMLPFPTWPKSMNVISRTNLDLDTPTANGLLLYRQKDFTKAIKEIFGE
jgi:hypothetical protein